MGVLPCARAGCDRIMCDRVSSEYGYICNDCFSELVNSGRTDVREFMGQPREIKPVLDYDKIFPLRWE